MKTTIVNLYKRLRWFKAWGPWSIEPFIFLDYQADEVVKCFPLWLEVSIIEPTPEVFEAIPNRDANQTLRNYRSLPTEEIKVDIEDGPMGRTHPRCLIYRAVATRHPRGEILSCKIIDGWIWTIVPNDLTPKMVAAENERE